VVPEDPELTLPSLDAQLVPEPAGRVPVDLAGPEELDESLSQRSADVVAGLGRVLVAALARGRPCRPVALGHDPALPQPPEDRELAILPIGVPEAVVEQVVLAVARDLLEDLPLRGDVQGEIGDCRFGQLGGEGGRPPEDRERTLDIQAGLDRPRLAPLGAI